MRRIQGPAAREHINQLKVGERHQHRERHHDGDDRRQQRQRYMAKLLPRGRAIEARRLVVRRRDCLQPGEQRDGHERHPAPDVGGDGRKARVPWIAEKVDVAVNEAYLHQHPADDRELRIVNPPECECGQGRRNDEGQEHDRAEERLERQTLVQQQREIEPESEFDHARDRRVEERVEKGQPRDGVAPKKFVVLEADPDAAPPDLGIGEAEIGA